MAITTRSSIKVKPVCLGMMLALGIEITVTNLLHILSVMATVQGYFDGIVQRTQHQIPNLSIYFIIHTHLLQVNRIMLKLRGFFAPPLLSFDSFVATSVHLIRVTAALLLHTKPP